MAGITRFAGDNVRWTLACRVHAIMTTFAGLTRYLLMGKRRYPAARVMTLYAGLRRRYMGCALTRRNRAVVATFTGAHDLIMIHLARGDRYPHRGRDMTGITFITRENVVATLAGADGAVMTKTTRNVAYPAMVKQPVVRGMTDFAGIAAGRYMGRALAGGDGPVVTAFAATVHLRVIHTQYRHPYAHAMTGIAYIGTINMSRGFAGGDNTIMTTDATAGNFRVIDKRCGYPCRDTVAGIAAITG